MSAGSGGFSTGPALSGRVDQGGGGTIAKFLAEYGMDIVDCGPSLLAMHSPFEISSKGDVFMTYRAYQAFFKSGD